MNGLTNLKDYIVEFQKGKDEVLNYLIGHRQVPEKNLQRQTEYITRIYYKDKKLNEIYFNITKKFHWLDDKDIEEWFLYGLYEKVFPDADITKDPQQIINWASQTLNGYIQNKVNKERKDDKHTVSEHVDAFDVGEVGKGDESEGIYSLYEIKAFEEFKEAESHSEYEEFITFVGGIKNILTKQQYKLYKLIQDGTKTQADVAEEYGCSTANVSKQIEKIHKQIKAKWLYYKSVKALTDSGLYQKIKQFTIEYENIKKHDVGGNFDYFGWMLDFLKDNYKNGEQDVESRQLHKNKVTLSMTVFDILTDNVTKKTYNNLYDVLENGLDIKEFDTYSFGKREKKIIVNQVIKAFSNYINESNKAIEKASEYMANNKTLPSSSLSKYIS